MEPKHEMKTPQCSDKMERVNLTDFDPWLAALLNPRDAIANMTLCSQVKDTVRFMQKAYDEMHVFLNQTAEKTLRLIPQLQTGQNGQRARRGTFQNILHAGNMIWSYANHRKIQKLQRHAKVINKNFADTQNTVNNIQRNFQSFVRHSIRHQRLIDVSLNRTHHIQADMYNNLRLLEKQQQHFVHLVVKSLRHSQHVDQIYRAAYAFDVGLRNMIAGRMDENVVTYEQFLTARDHVNARVRQLGLPSASVAISAGQFFTDKSMKFWLDRDDKRVFIHCELLINNHEYVSTLYRIHSFDVSLNQTSKIASRLDYSDKFIAVSRDNTLIARFRDEEQLRENRLTRPLYSATENCVYNLIIQARDKVMRYCRYRVSLRISLPDITQINANLVVLNNVDTYHLICPAETDNGRTSTRTFHATAITLLRKPACCALKTASHIIVSEDQICSGVEISVREINNMGFLMNFYGLPAVKYLSFAAAENAQLSYQTFEENAEGVRDLDEQLQRSSIGMENFIKVVNQTQPLLDLQDLPLADGVDFIAISALALAVILVPVGGFAYHRLCTILPALVLKQVSKIEALEFPVNTAAPLFHEARGDVNIKLNSCLGTGYYVVLALAIITPLVIVLLRRFWRYPAKNKVCLNFESFSGDSVIIQWLALRRSISSYHFQTTVGLSEFRVTRILGGRLTFKINDMTVTSLYDNRSQDLIGNIPLNPVAAYKLQKIVRTEDTSASLVTFVNGTIKDVRLCGKYCEYCKIAFDRAPILHEVREQ